MYLEVNGGEYIVARIQKAYILNCTPNLITKREIFKRLVKCMLTSNSFLWLADMLCFQENTESRNS